MDEAMTEIELRLLQTVTSPPISTIYTLLYDYDRDIINWYLGHWQMQFTEK